MNNLKYQKDYWKSFITSSQEDMLAKDLNSSWDENSKSYSTPTEIPKPYLDYIKQDIILQQYFNTHKKKDDLADTFLQTVSYLNKLGNNITTVSLDSNHLLDNE